MTEASTFRLLNACEACGRQYDVSHLEHGVWVRCECSARFAVRVQTPHSPRALCCSGCGANVKAGAPSCAFCAAEVTLEERRLTAVCPKCFARTGREARFCMECGVAISPQALFAVREGVSCPRCKGALHARGVANGSLVECLRCGGMWLGNEDFVRICKRAEEESLVQEFHLTAPTHPVAANASQGYAPCVVCSELMNRRNYASASGVLIDLCGKHGVWLDHGEIDKILNFIRAGGLERARRRELQRLEDQRQRLRSEQASARGVGGGFVVRGEERSASRGLLGATGLELGASAVGAFLDWML